MVGVVDLQKVPPAFDPIPQLLLTHGYDLDTAERIIAQWQTHQIG